MRITQGAFSYLADLTDEQIGKQVAYAVDNGWSIMIEHTDDPHPRNFLWEMWDQPMFELEPDDADQAVEEVNKAREQYPQRYIRITCYDRSLGYQTSRLSFIVNRPDDEPGFRLDRTETNDRVINYSLHSYAADDPPGRRYGVSQDGPSQDDYSSAQDRSA